MDCGCPMFGCRTRLPRRSPLRFSESEPGTALPPAPDGCFGGKFHAQNFRPSARAFQAAFLAKGGPPPFSAPCPDPEHPGRQKVRGERMALELP